MKYFIALISIILGSTGQYLLKVGMNNVDITKPFLSEIKINFKVLFFNSYLWAGLAAYGLSMVFWLFVLSKLDLNKAYPLASLGYIITMTLGFFLLGESFGINKVIGAVLIVSGVIVINIV